MLLIWLLLRASTHTGWAALSWWGNVLWLILIDLLFQPGSLSSDTHHIPELQVAVLCGPDVQTTWCIYIYIGQRISYDYTDTWTVLMQWKVQNCWKFSCHIEATSSVKDLPNQYCVLRWPWYGAGLCDREVAGSTPARGCCVPTPTQRAIPPGSVRLMSTSESWGVNGHTTRCTSPVSVVRQLRLVSGWGLRKRRSALSCGPLRLGKGLYWILELIKNEFYLFTRRGICYVVWRLLQTSPQNTLFYLAVIFSPPSDSPAPLI